MEGIRCGLSGDLFRGGTAIGLKTATALSIAAVKEGLRLNPTARKFVLRVNQFEIDRAESIAAAFGVPIEVVSEPRLSRDSWTLDPVE
jgi:hypothetical protein